MIDTTLYLTIALASLAGITILAAAMLAGWRGWLALKHTELSAAHGGASLAPNAGARIEIADLKERIRKLEAIAAGVDL